jgi:hydrogenase-1 operon protein HyaF
MLTSADAVHVDKSVLAAARDALVRLLDAFARCDPAHGDGSASIDLFDLEPAVRDAVAHLLGEGGVDVSVRATRIVHAKETVFAGVWRVRELDASGRTLADRLEAVPLPRIAVEAARAVAHDAAPDDAGAWGSGTAREVLADVTARARERRGCAHVVNLTLLPLDSDDHRALERALPAGPVAIVARGFARCRVCSTLVRDVWRVRYFSALDALILDTIEVVAVPEIALAAPDDLADSRTRLAELVEWISDGRST